MLRSVGRRIVVFLLLWGGFGVVDFILCVGEGGERRECR